jgi:hypothetical protein
LDAANARLAEWVEYREGVPIPFAEAVPVGVTAPGEAEWRRGLARCPELDWELSVLDCAEYPCIVTMWSDRYPETGTIEQICPPLARELGASGAFVEHLQVLPSGRARWYNAAILWRADALSHPDAEGVRAALRIGQTWDAGLARASARRATFAEELAYELAEERAVPAKGRKDKSAKHRAARIATLQEKVAKHGGGSTADDVYRAERRAEGSEHRWDPPLRPIPVPTDGTCTAALARAREGIATNERRYWGEPLRFNDRVPAEYQPAAVSAAVETAVASCGEYVHLLTVECSEFPCRAIFWSEHPGLTDRLADCQDAWDKGPRGVYGTEDEYVLPSSVHRWVKSVSVPQVTSEDRAAYGYSVRERWDARAYAVRQAVIEAWGATPMIPPRHRGIAAK